MNAHRPSWIRSHLRFYGRQWMIGGIAVSAIIFIAFMIWVTSISIEFYDAQPALKQTNERVDQPRITRRNIDVSGPVSLHIEPGPLRHGTQTTIIRDLTAILKQRLQDRGLTIKPKSQQAVVVSYSEEEGQTITFSRPGQDDRIGSAKDTVIWLQIKFVSPTIASQTISTLVIQSRKNQLEIVGQQSVSSVRRSLYQQSYARLLSSLKKVDLTILSPKQVD